jgi:putative flippase GtrA
MLTMRIVTRKDVLSAVATGFTTGVIGWRILVFLGRTLPAGIDPVILVPLVPVVWLAGVQFGYILSAWFRPFAQFGRFACIGFANALVDFGVLYVLIAYSGQAEGTAYSVFKALSFAFATIHSYLWNKYWAFDAARTSGGSREVASFVAVALASLLVNVAAASLVVALRPAPVSADAWAGIGAVVGSAAALVFSFTGFRVFVFRKK